jgi:hypothetical protein
MFFGTQQAFWIVSNFKELLELEWEFGTQEIFENSESKESFSKNVKETQNSK